MQIGDRTASNVPPVDHNRPSSATHAVNLSLLVNTSLRISLSADTPLPTRTLS
jgi:hypothetical protein